MYIFCILTRVRYKYIRGRLLAGLDERPFLQEGFVCLTYKWVFLGVCCESALYNKLSKGDGRVQGVWVYVLLKKWMLSFRKTIAFIFFFYVVARLQLTIDYFIECFCVIRIQHCFIFIAECVECRFGQAGSSLFI